MKKKGKSLTNNRRLLRGEDNQNYVVPIHSTKKLLNSRDSYENAFSAKKIAFSPARFRTIALDSKPDYSHHIKMTVGKKRSPD